MPSAFSSRMHWLTFDQENRVIACHCGWVADDSDSGYGDSIVNHIAYIVALETLNSICYPPDSPIPPHEIAGSVAYGS